MMISMKYLLSLSTLIFLIACNSKTVKNKSTEASEVSIAVVFTSDYCGGANPPDGILQALSVERPLTNSDLVIKSVETGDIQRATTDGEGTVKISLSTGKYELFDPTKLTAEPASNDALLQSQCIEWKKTPDAVFELTKDEQTIAVKIHKTCNPCEQSPN